MNKREAKILILETIAKNCDSLIELDCISNEIKSTKDYDLINQVFDELSNKLLERSKKLRKSCPLSKK